MRKNLANIITCFRILCSILLLFFPVFSLRFYILYFLCGVSDIMDGAVARKTNSISPFGSRLDTVADFIFVLAALIKVLPKIEIPLWLLIWIFVIFVIKIINLISGFYIKKRLVVAHTVMNKITGALLFILTFTVTIIELNYTAIAVCSIATISAIQEGYCIRSEKDKFVQSNTYIE